MLGAILGAGVGLFSNLFGASKQKQAEEKAAAAEAAQRQEMARREAEEKALLDRRINENYVERADVQRLMSMARENAERQVKRAYGVNAMMGGTGQDIRNAQDSANKMLADTSANIAAQASDYKANLQDQKIGSGRYYGNQLMSYYQGQQQRAGQEAANYAAAASEGMKAGMGILAADGSAHLNTGRGMFESMFKKKKEGNDANT